MINDYTESADTETSTLASKTYVKNALIKNNVLQDEKIETAKNTAISTSKENTDSSITETKEELVNRMTDLSYATKAILNTRINNEVDTINDKFKNYATLEDVKEKELTPTLKSAIFDMIYPIGRSYIQPPNCPPPTELFPDFTWEEVDLSGAFLRFNGGNAQAYEKQKSPQAAQAPNITGKLIAGYGAANKSYGLSFGNGSGAFAPITSSITQDTYNGGSYVVSGGSSATFDSSLDGASVDINGKNIYTNSGELRPENYTFKLWKRTL